MSFVRVIARLLLESKGGRHTGAEILSHEALSLELEPATLHYVHIYVWFD